MISFPNCKINLGLWITGRRADGYHNIESVLIPAGWCDVLEILPTSQSETTLTLSGLYIEGSPTQNLCFRAWELMRTRYGIAPVQMHLHKIVPTGAGLGGGSADGAFALRMLNDLFDLSLSLSDLEDLASQLGMDCSFFIRNKPAVATGRGEELREISLSLDGLWLVVVKPPVMVSTAKAYSMVKPLRRDSKLSHLIQSPVDEWEQLLENDFEDSVFKLFPEISQVKKQLYALGAVYAAMSGSGSAVFGIFRQKPETDHFKNCQVYCSLFGSEYK